MYKLVLAFIAAVIASSTAYNQVLKIRVNPQEAFGGPASEYFDTIEYIPLETTKESLFGYPGQLILTESTIVVADPDTRCILFFNLKDGRFIKKISLSQDQGYMVDYNKIKNLIIVNHYPAGKSGTVEYNEYSADGNLLHTRKKAYKNIDITYYYMMDSGYYCKQKIFVQPISELKSIKDASIPLISIYDSRDSLKKQFLFSRPLDNPFIFSRGGASISQSGSGQLFAVLPYDYRLFTFTKDTIQQIGQFIFPLTAVIPEKAVHSKNLDYIDSLQKSQGIEVKKNLVESVNNISFYQSRILFTLRKPIRILPGGSNSVSFPLNYMYDTTDKQLTAFERISPDEKSNYLPIMDGFSSSSGMNLHKNILYSSVSSLQMFAAKAATASKNPVYPPVLQQYFATQNRKSNPVIVRMQLKNK